MTPGRRHLAAVPDGQGDVGQMLPACPRHARGLGYRASCPDCRTTLSRHVAKVSPRPQSTRPAPDMCPVHPVFPAPPKCPACTARAELYPHGRPAPAETAPVAPETPDPHPTGSGAGYAVSDVLGPAYDPQEPPVDPA